MPAVRRESPAPTESDDAEISGRASFAVHQPTAARLVIAVTGEVDATNRQALGLFVERHLPACEQFILDLREVDFFGSQGFTALPHIHMRCASRGVDWTLVGSRMVRRTLQICDPHTEMPLADNIAAAIQRLDHRARCRLPSLGRQLWPAPQPLGSDATTRRPLDPSSRPR